MFQPVEGSVQFPKLEESVGQFWLERDIYRKSLDRPAPQGPFIFYEGPPTANGMPHPGHCLTRAIKDLFPRYKTMRGYRCQRKAGWDTHGLPVEVEVCKELGIHSKEEIEAYGIEKFIQLCQRSVWRYMQEWERLTRRIGFWVDLEQAYVTYHQSYVESVWWSLKNLFDRGLLYQGHKIVWWWAQGGTALSSGEVGQGYRQVADPSVYVRFPIVPDERARKLGLDENTSLLVWTTTPWTLPSNQFAAVHPELEYAVVSVSLGHEPPGGETNHPPANAGGSESKLIIASALVETIAQKAKCEFMVERTIKGTDLIGLRYVPPFDGYRKASDRESFLLKPGQTRFVANLVAQEHVAWRVVSAEFVTTESGSGVVHQAPAFGEVDYEVLIRERARFTDGPELLNAVGPDGKFTDEGPEYCRGRWVKDCDKDITRDLKQRGLLFHQEQYLHDYPFCWRAEEDPLIQYPRRSWFIKTSEFKAEMLKNNARINWLPEHIKDGRFGNFLETNVDWALSRERYWGTPLPIWVCEATGHMEAVASYDELLAKPRVQGTEVWAAAKKANPDLVDDLKVHKPYIDAVTYDSPKQPGARMRRVTEVIDCWYDSGAMPFAQWGYRGQASGPVAEQFTGQFPADFISEAIDQTRGWFYSQLAIATLLRQAFPKQDYPLPFKNCVVLGLMLGEDGQKMSKSKRNYREPNEIFDRYGADALRWYFYANQPPWTGIRYNEQAIKESIPEFLLRLWNVYSFFVIYANIDGFDPAAELSAASAKGADQRLRFSAAPLGDLKSDVLAQGKTYRPVAERSELDRWITSELHRTLQVVTERMDAYDNFAACQRITQLVDALSNWYVRRSRDRFWSADKHDRDKLDAYWTLYECLLTTTKLVAPFVPFLAEAMWQNLAVAGCGKGADGKPRTVESVHLADFPAVDASLVNESLAREMELVREIVSLGRSARTGAKLKVRQPLDKVEIVLPDPQFAHWLGDHAPLIREELNVKQVEFAAKADQYVSYTILPDLKKLGPKLGKQLPVVKKLLAEADPATLKRQLDTDGKVSFTLSDGAVTLEPDELQIRLQAKPGWAAAQGTLAVVVLSTDLTPELISEGWARELIHAIQTLRKDKGCQYTDRIELGIVSDSAEIAAAVRDFAQTIRDETLCTSLHSKPIAGVTAEAVSLAGHEAQIYLQVVKS